MPPCAPPAAPPERHSSIADHREYMTAIPIGATAVEPEVPRIQRARKAAGGLTIGLRSVIDRLGERVVDAPEQAAAAASPPRRVEGVVRGVGSGVEDIVRIEVGIGSREAFPGDPAVQVPEGLVEVVPALQVRSLGPAIIQLNGVTVEQFPFDREVPRLQVGLLRIHGEAVDRCGAGNRLARGGNRVASDTRFGVALTPTKFCLVANETASRASLSQRWTSAYAI